MDPLASVYDVLHSSGFDTSLGMVQQTLVQGWTAGTSKCQQTKTLRKGENVLILLSAWKKRKKSVKFRTNERLPVGSYKHFNQHVQFLFYLLLKQPLLQTCIFFVL